MKDRVIALSHVAIAVPNLRAIQEKLEALSLRVSEKHSVPTEKVTAAMIPVKVSPEFRIELLEPTAEDSPIAKFLMKHSKGGLHHLSFEVTGLSEWLELLQKEGIEVLPPGIRKAARGKALFIHPRDMGGVLVELEELS